MFVQLTVVDTGEKFWINTDHVRYFDADEEGGTRLFTTAEKDGDPESFLVCEERPEIVAGLFNSIAIIRAPNPRD